MKSPIAYYGGKSYMAGIIRSMFPKEYKAYVEGFGGGASVLLSAPHSGMEIYNDLGRNVYSLFKCLSDESLFDEFCRKASVSVYSRDLNREFAEDLKRDDLPVVERAWKFFYVNNTSFNGIGGFSTGLESRFNLQAALSRYLTKVDGLAKFHERLMNVTVENLDIFELIPKYDSESTFFYLDPPYVASTRATPDQYEHEMSDNQHERFLDLCLSSKGMFLISGYNHPIYDRLIDAGWKRFDFEAPHDKRHVESLWYNYSLDSKALF